MRPAMADFSPDRSRFRKTAIECSWVTVSFPTLSLTPSLAYTLKIIADLVARKSVELAEVLLSLAGLSHPSICQAMHKLERRVCGFALSKLP